MNNIFQKNGFQNQNSSPPAVFGQRMNLVPPPQPVVTLAPVAPMAPVVNKPTVN